MPAPPFRFTIFDLESCIEVARTVQAKGGRLSSAELAAHMGYKSDNNGSFNTRLANARLFGLITGSSSAIEPTERALAILHPDYPATAVQARVDAFTSVPLYAAVLDQYHGQPLPDETGLRNALSTRWGINADKAPMVLARLLESADQAGLFSTTGRRDRMIRPSVGPAPAAAEHETPEGVEPAPSPAPAVSGVRQNKLIDGTLEMLPDDRTWDEMSLKHWMRFFEDALRLYYNLPRIDTPSANGVTAVAALPARKGGDR